MCTYGALVHTPVIANLLMQTVNIAGRAENL